MIPFGIRVFSVFFVFCVFVTLSLAKNTFYLTAALVGQKIISFVYFMLVARTIGVTNTGKYFFALSFTTIFVVFIDLGLNQVMVREVSRSKDKAQTYLSAVLGAKMGLGALSYLAVIVALELLGTPASTRQLVYVSGITMLFDSLHLSLYGILRAMGDLRYEAVSVAASQLITMILGGIFLYARLPLAWLIVAFTVPSFLNACFAATVLARRHRIRLRPIFDEKALRPLARMAIPFALSAVFARVYGYIDTILLSKLAGETVVGWYSIPYKITFAFQFIPLALSAAFYPKISDFYANDKNKISPAFAGAVKYLLMLSFPIAIGIAILAEPIILLMSGPQYLPSVLPLQILIMSLLFSFISFPIGALLNACHRQRTQTAIVGFVLTVNVIMNVLLIPRFEAVGAAIAAFTGNAFLTILGYIFVSRTVSLAGAGIGKILAKISGSAAVMGAVVWWANRLVERYDASRLYGVIACITLGAVVYLGMLLLTKTMQLRDIANLKHQVL